MAYIDGSQHRRDDHAGEEPVRHETRHERGSILFFLPTFRGMPAANAEGPDRIGWAASGRSRRDASPAHLQIGHGASALAVGTLRDVEKKKNGARHDPLGRDHLQQPRLGFVGLDVGDGAAFFFGSRP